MTVPTQGHLKLVIRYADGRTVRGVTDNFWPGRDTFHVQDVGRPGGSEPVEIHVSELKAVYVVKDFAGSTSTGVVDMAAMMKNLQGSGKPLRVRFKDGETVLGTTMDYNPNAIGFFLFPANPDSNNERIYVVNGQVAEVEPVRVGAQG